METLSVSLTLCEGNPPITSEFPSQRSHNAALKFSLMLNWESCWINRRMIMIWHAMKLMWRHHSKVPKNHADVSCFVMYCFWLGPAGIDEIFCHSLHLKLSNGKLKWEMQPVSRISLSIQKDNFRCHQWHESHQNKAFRVHCCAVYLLQMSLPGPFHCCLT